MKWYYPHQRDKTTLSSAFRSLVINSLTKCSFLKLKNTLNPMNLFKKKYILFHFSLHDFYKRSRDVTKKKTTNQSKGCKQFDNVRPGYFFSFMTLCAN
jgi:hypothetical protein